MSTLSWFVVQNIKNFIKKRQQNKFPIGLLKILDYSFTEVEIYITQNFS